MRHTILNAKERKVFLARLYEQFGISFHLEGCALLRSPKGRYYLSDARVFAFPFEQLRIDTLGLYIASDEVDGLRLSIEGAQLLGPHASHHVLDVDTQQLSEWLLGHVLTVDASHLYEGSYVLIRCGHDYAGCGKVKEGNVLNYVPKTRWINAVHD